MGRTKNSQPKRRAQVDLQEEPADVPSQQEESVSPIESRPIQIPIGPNRTVSVEVPSPKPKTIKRQRMIIQEEDDDDDNGLNIELNDDPEEVKIVESVTGTTTVHVQTNLTRKNEGDIVESWELLKQYKLSDTSIQYFQGDEIRHEILSFSLTTAQGTDAIIRHCHHVKDSDIFVPIGQAVEDGTITVDIFRGEGYSKVCISLTKKALQVANPVELPMETLRRRRGKKFQVATNLHLALAWLFPDTVLADVIQTKRNQEENPITAKMVYDVVDNVQLNHYEKSICNSTKKLGIPGLVPKLRPYQEAAVRWMLDREQDITSSSANEWELAWVTVSDEKVVPLSSSVHRVDGIFLCPFAGWLVSSYAKARDVSNGCAPPVRGGICAESMGLGKTVEVIACILGNQFGGKQGFKSLGEEFETINEETNGCTPIALANNSSEESNENSPSQRQELGLNDENPPAISEQSPSGKATNPESDMLMKTIRDGACICGKIASFNGCLSFVVCRTCHEPMHGVCAGFSTIAQVIEETTIDRAARAMENKIVRMCSDERCPGCVYANRSEGRGLIQSRATLIVTPPAILSQWEREIRRHTSIEQKPATCSSPGTEQHEAIKQSLKVVVYPGIRELFRRKPATTNEHLGRPECHMIHPNVLADADVVLMTFDALMGDLGHSDENPYIDDGSARLRQRKRFRVVPSPLTSIKWWRVCLDEAQRVETPTATSARMALKLETEHRWCVSGTPIGRGKLDDLYGLLLFLRLSPFSSKSWFQNCLRPSHRGIMERVQQLLQTVLWRSTKSSESVRNQMGIPPQIEKKVMLQFSSIEKHFYDRQLEQTMVAASDLMGKVTKKRNSTKLVLLSHHLHRLRAACCHPQVGATGLGKATKRRKTHSSTADHEASVGSGVLTMDQILDRLIDDAKLQCEESQRLAVMHTNAMAALSRLKVEAKQQGSDFPEADDFLLKKSCDLYKESLDIAEVNSTPSPVIGEAILSGCRGFLSPGNIIRDGKCLVPWFFRVGTEQLTDPELWARYDFEGPPKKICQIRVQPSAIIPTEFNGKASHVLHPKDCVFQVSHSALGGEFVDVVNFSLDKDAFDVEMSTFGGFRTNKSKSWRLVVKNYHDSDIYPPGEIVDLFIGLSVELFEPDIASDSLQRLHVLHNAALSMMSLQQLRSSVKGKSSDDLLTMTRHVEQMQAECEKIECLYLDGARALHREIKREFEEAGQKRKDAENELAALCLKGTKRKIRNFWQDMWWDDALSNCFLNGTPHEREQLCLRVQNDLQSFSQSQVGQDYRKENSGKGLPSFNDVDGIQTGLGFRLADYIDSVGEEGYSECMSKFSRLSAFPSQAEQIENSHCGKCHIDWNQSGPECSHCKLETRLKKVSPDALILCVLTSIFKWLKDTKVTGSMRAVRMAARIDERAEKFFETIKAGEKEWQRGKKAWRIHLDLLNDIDEVNQCKRSMRLALDDEDLTILTDDELNAICVPIDIPVRLMDHSAKQAMALGTLRRHTHTLRYLKNQNKERQEERLNKDIESTNCVLCLSAMEGERAVLACGHSFHRECVERLLGGRKAHGSTMISCPLRCTTKTKKQEILIASDHRKDDGSQRTRDIAGSWGTKVTRLVCDLLNVSDLGEKSIVFSQWEDMLWVVEQALIANKVGYAHPKSLKQIGEDIKRFRSNDCPVLLLNVKNGAEGLTLVEATHIFMVEPLLNCGLDSQAISRIHRIGQTRTTYVHRFLIEDTIEVKIDKLRMERQEDHQLEDSINEARKKHEIEGGGIDGGFSQEELQDLLK